MYATPSEKGNWNEAKFHQVFRIQPRCCSIVEDWPKKYSRFRTTCGFNSCGWIEITERSPWTTCDLFRIKIICWKENCKDAGHFECIPTIAWGKDIPLLLLLISQFISLFFILAFQRQARKGRICFWQTHCRKISRPLGATKILPKCLQSQRGSAKWENHSKARSRWRLW